jgi:hypothetical protein
MLVLTSYSLEWATITYDTTFDQSEKVAKMMRKKGQEGDATARSAGLYNRHDAPVRSRTTNLPWGHRPWVSPPSEAWSR